MTDKSKKIEGPKPFPASFYAANVMELFERVAWYGFFTVSSLYMTSSPTSGGLGLSETQRGVLQGIIPFAVYIFPVFTGALGDRVGYKKMFIAAFIILIPAYYMLGQVDGFPLFFAFYMMVALGAAIFKPLVVGTVARSADDSNRGLAFGIFYLMVNVGGFIGPVAAGQMRAISWDYVFLLSSCSIVVNLFIVFFFIKETTERPAGGGIAALKDAQKVLGNVRFALVVAPILIALMLAGGDWIRYRDFTIFALGWLIVNVIWNVFSSTESKAWYAQKTRVGDGPFLVYLLVLSIFWAAYNQIFITLPLYIRDFVDTGDLVAMASAISPAFADFISPLKIAELTSALPEIARAFITDAGPDALRTARHALADYQILPPPNVVSDDLIALAAGNIDAAALAEGWAREHRQVSPEYILAIDFLAIVLFQFFVSRGVQKRKPFGVLVAGSLLIGVGYALGGVAHATPFGGLVCAGAVLVFAFGEMLASPKSQEYVAAIAPREQSALFMGYYFVSMALGFLFAGIISGVAYEKIAIQMNNPGLMWMNIAAVAVAAALALVWFDRTMARHMGKRTAL